MYGVYMDVRQQKGFEIAKTKQIQEKRFGWEVPSQTDSRKRYFVNQEFVCDCPDSELHEVTCKHAFAVRYYLKQVIETPQGDVVKEKRLTYPQAWSVYNQCQQEEKVKFMELLSDLLQEVEEPAYVFGRPKISTRTLLFASALKVYTNFSLRRFRCDLDTAREKGFVGYEPAFSSISAFMQREDLTPILSRLVQLSAITLKSVEKDFAVDSSGFRLTSFSEYCKDKHHMIKKHQWLKCHIMTGVKSNIITAVEIGLEHHSADVTQFIPLVNATADAGFKIEEVSADKAYVSFANYNAAKELGGQAFIPFKSNTAAHHPAARISKSKAWRKMFHFYQLHQEEFMEHYHKRSNVESTFFMLKSKFSDLIRSKNTTAQINELLLKILCHNIVVVAKEAELQSTKSDFSVL